MAEQINLTFEKLLDWIENKLPPDEAQAVAEQVAELDLSVPSADVTRADEDWIRLFEQARHRVILAEPPAHIRAALAGRFVAYSEAKREQNTGTLKRLVAALTLDSFTELSTAGVRSVTLTQPRQIIFSVEGYDIAVHVTPEGGGENYAVQGQILQDEQGEVDLLSTTSSIAVQLLQDEQHVDMVACDEIGEFAFSKIAAGGYHFVLIADDFEIETPVFQI